MLAIATLYLSAVGTEVVESGHRRFVDPPWFRGSSYLKIGWRWLRQSLVHGWKLPACLSLSDSIDSDPAIASRSQAAQRNSAFQFYAPGTTVPLTSRAEHLRSA